MRIGPDHALRPLPNDDVRRDDQLLAMPRAPTTPRVGRTVRKRGDRLAVFASLSPAPGVPSGSRDIRGLADVRRTYASGTLTGQFGDERDDHRRLGVASAVHGAAERQHRAAEQKAQCDQLEEPPAGFGNSRLIVERQQNGAPRRTRGRTASGSRCGSSDSCAVTLSARARSPTSAGRRSPRKRADCWRNGSRTDRTAGHSSFNKLSAAPALNHSICSALYVWRQLMTSCLPSACCTITRTDVPGASSFNPTILMRSASRTLS